MLGSESENYMVRSNSAEFSDRQKSIFDQLDAIKVENRFESNIVYKSKGKKFMKTVSGKVCTDFDARHKDFDTKNLKGKESIFKTPDIPRPVRKRQQIPDFIRNPHKWKKYSLSDVTPDDMSDQSNTAAAMAFLNELKSRKSTADDDDEPMEIDNKITFKRPFRPKVDGVRSQTVQVSKDDSPGEDGISYFRGSKLIMPEYVVGEKKVKAKKHDLPSDSKDNRSTEIKLNHLTEYDDGDEDDSNVTI